MPQYFSKTQVELLHYLAKQKTAKTIQETTHDTGIDQIFIAGDSQALSEMGILSIKEENYNEISLDTEGFLFYKEGFPERRILRTLLEKGEQGLSIPQLAEYTGLTSKEIGQTLKVLASKQWATNNKGILTLGPQAAAARKKKEPEEELITYLGTKAYENALAEEDTLTFQEEELLLAVPSYPQAITNLKGRKKVLAIKERKRRYLSLTDLGKQTIKQGIAFKEEVTALTHEMLEAGTWKDVVFKPYNIQEDTEPIYPGKTHPFTRVLQETRRVFFDMGFTEIHSPYIESSFWNFDALFQPQDHPAREMQDTFYMKQPKEGSLPENEVVSNVKATHENGGDTGSIGWMYKWDTEKARQMVLRTHCTSASIQQIAKRPTGPQKVFCLGRVFRCETVDYKHLPEFMQVDGIIIDEHASFSHLIGTLYEFYRKMGFEKVDFRPGFFPYTEPSLEVFVYLESKKDWVEMGGSGIFRPEVTQPFGCDVPVLAWGLGLERLAMFRYGISDIRNIYMTDLKWLKEVGVCQ